MFSTTFMDPDVLLANMSTKMLIKVDLYNHHSEGLHC